MALVFYRRVLPLALTTLALFVLSPELSTRVAASNGEGYCDLPEFETCEICESIDFQAEYFDGCGILIQDSNITM